MKRPVLLVLISLMASTAYAKKSFEPCRTKSRQMTLVKNCYAGEMARLGDGGNFYAFFPQVPSERSYCYNSLITLTHKAKDNSILIRVVRDGKDGQVHAYNYAMKRVDSQKGKPETFTFALQGLKAECFTKKPEGCGGGLLKTMGLMDNDLPLVISVGKNATGQFSVTQILYNPDQIEKLAPKEIVGQMEKDGDRVTKQLLYDIGRKIVTVARLKVNAMHAGTSAKALADASEQFRYCSMALEGFLKDKKMTDPFSSEEKMTLAKLTNYMNGDAAVGGRMPASLPTKSSKN